MEKFLRKPLARDVLAAPTPADLGNDAFSYMTLQEIAPGNEPVRIEGEVAGRVTTGGHGYMVERSVAYAHLPPAAEPGTAVEVEIFGRRVPGKVAEAPPYARIKS